MGRPDITRYLIDTVNIERDTRLDLGHGRFEQKYTPLYTGIPARLFLLQPLESMIGDQRKTYTRGTLYLEPSRSDVRHEDHILPQTGACAGRKFRVTASQDPSINYYRKLMIEELQ